MFPWTVALYYNNQFICTASVISPTTVLTAAHCVVLEGQLQSADLFYGIAGNVNKSSPVVRLNFRSVTPHPDYENLQNDVAIFKTVDKIPLGENISPICIAGPDSRSLDYKRVTAMGWGTTSRSRIAQPIPDILQFVGQRVVPNNQCSLLFYFGQLADTGLCAGGLFRGICNGDSGGPLVYFKGQDPVEVGIASYINALIGCGFIGPAVFTRVSSYYDFIMQTAGDGQVCMVSVP
ncbi:Chymotrypsin-like protease CTRL-1, partial [Stegodyphus mimosarum]